MRSVTKGLLATGLTVLTACGSQNDEPLPRNIPEHICRFSEGAVGDGYIDPEFVGRVLGIDTTDIDQVQPRRARCEDFISAMDIAAGAGVIVMSGGLRLEPTQWCAVLPSNPAGRDLVVGCPVL